MNYISNIGLFDWTLAVLYLIIVYFLAKVYQNKKIKNNPEYKYFIFGLTAKIAGGIGFAIFSVYYYKGGDTFVFFNAAEGLANYFFKNFSGALDVLFTSANNLNLGQHNFAPNYNYILISEDVLTIVKITTGFNFISFNSYLVSSILFSLTSFLGLWFGYSNFCKLYPNAAKYMLVAFFLIPSAVLWSSGILKDTVTQGCIGWLLFSFSNIFIFKRKFLLSVVVIVISSLILFLLKPYILYILFPCLFIWVQFNLKNIIKASFIRLILKPFLFILLFGVGFILFQNVSKNAGKYNMKNIEKTLVGFQSWHEYLTLTGDQSGYSLGEMEYTPMGIAQKIPAALNVTFFRPYLSEVRNVPTLLGAFEALMLLIYLGYLLVTLRLIFFKIMLKNKEVLFMMLFALTFGVVVGISSYNFGALSRYKIPALMFFVLSLIIIQLQGKKKC